MFECGCLLAESSPDHWTRQVPRNIERQHLDELVSQALVQEEHTYHASRTDRRP